MTSEETGPTGLPVVKFPRQPVHYRFQPSQKEIPRYPPLENISSQGSPLTVSIAGLSGTISTPRSCAFSSANPLMVARKTNIGMGRCVILVRQQGQAFGRCKMLRGPCSATGAFLNQSCRQRKQKTWPQ